MLDLALRLPSLWNFTKSHQNEYRKDNSYYLEAEPWMLDEVTIVQDGGLSLSGWVLPPPAEGKVKFSINGKPVDAQFPINRPGMQKIFWQRQNACASGFRLQLNESPETLFKNGFVSVRAEYRGQPRKYPFQYDYYLPSAEQSLPVPDESRRFRVIGTNAVEPFLRGGFTDFMRIRQLTKRVTGKDFASLRSILDWGTGCGRVARHFSTVKNVKFNGGDIDGDNIDWCSTNLKFGSFTKLPLFPPTPYANNEFDLVYGISVFTHLKENAQDAWLQELQRITKPGGVVMVTCHGQTTLTYAGLNQEHMDYLLPLIEERGIYVTAVNDQINEFIDDKEYYVNVNHSKKYIREHWGKYFQILDIIPGFIFTHDMIVMRKRR